MLTRDDIASVCLAFPDSYEDHPFSDTNWQVIRHSSNNKVFAWIFDRHGRVWVNFKGSPADNLLWRAQYECIIPAYHLNKEHWNSLILDDSIRDDIIKNMIHGSFDLTK
mgnify:CR=1 FL=1